MHRRLGFAARRRKRVLLHLTSDARNHQVDSSKSREVGTGIGAEILGAGRDPSVGGVDRPRV